MVVLCAVLAFAGVAHAERKRVVVLEFEGPKGEKFHDDLVKLLKKTHTVVPTDKWNGTAEQLEAGTLSDKNLKRVARKLKVDAIVEGRIEKRRDEFIIRLKLHEGRTGELIGGPIDTKAEGPRIDGRAQRDLNDELVGAIDNVESNRSSSVDDEQAARPARKAAKQTEADDEERPVKKTAKKAEVEADDEERPVKKTAKKAEAEVDDEDRPARKTAKKAEADDEDRPARKTAKKVDDEDRPVKRGFSKHFDDERGADRVDKRAAKATDEDDDKAPAKKSAKKSATRADDDDGEAATKPAGESDRASGSDDDDEDEPGRKPASKKKRVASREDDSTRAEVDVESRAPLDEVTALSPGERALDAVAGLSVTRRRMTFVFRSDLLAKPAGYKGAPVAGAMIDATFYPLAFAHTRSDQLKNIGLNVMYDRVLKIESQDPMTGTVYATHEVRYGIAAVFRHALFGTSAGAPIVIGSLGYLSQLFTIKGDVGTPNVRYTAFEPGAGVRIPLGAKLLVALDAKLMLITNTGAIQQPEQYGTAKVFGFEGVVGADYRITRNIFARAAFRYQTIGYTFKGTGAQTTMRDGDSSTQDISGARDSYIGGLVTAGYLY